MSNTPTAPAEAYSDEPENLFADMGENEGGEAGGDEEEGDGSEDEADPDGGDEGDDGVDPDGGEGDENADEGEEGDEEADEAGAKPGAVAVLPDDATIKIVVDGEDAEVTFKELREGYVRTETFHRRLNVLHEAKEVIQREAAQVASRRDESIALLDTLQDTLKTLVPTEPNWDEEFRKDPAAARQLQRQYEDYNKQVAAAKTASEKLKGERDQEEFVQTQEFANRENAKIPQVFPQWADPVVATRDKSSMKQTAKAAGFSDEEIAGILDTRMLAVLHKAATLDRMQARRAKPTTPKGKLQGNPGTGSTRTVPKGRTGASQRLAKTGSVEDAADVFAGLISR